jgi:hypothetical protein
MSRVQRIAVGTGACALVFALFCTARPSAAQRLQALSVAVGETAALAEAAALGPELRVALAEELSQNPDLRLAPLQAASVVVRGSITRLERTSSGSHGQVRCEVSLIVADRRGGSVRAMVSGRASAQGTLGRALDRAVIRAAVRGALRPLGRTLGRTH